MNIFQATSLFGIGLIVLVFALTCVGVGLWLLHSSRQNISFLFAPMLIGLALCGVMDVALSGRTMQSDFGSAVSEAALQDIASKLPVKLLLGFLAGLAVVALAGRIVQARQRAALPAALIASFVWFYVATNIVPAAFGYEPVFLYGLVYTPLILLAILVTAPSDPQATIRAVKAALLLIIVSSLVAALVAPSLVLQTSTKAFIPGFGKRLWGLTSHANVLGPAALTLCLIEWAQPYRSRIMHRSSFLLGLVALVLTQSKTSLVAAFAAVAVLTVYAFVSMLRGISLRSGNRVIYSNKVPMAMLGAGMLAIVLALVTIVVGDKLGLANAIAERLSNIDFNTVAGRTAIWHQAVTEGINHPLFGYGLNIWSPDYRLATGLGSAFHAHNQFLQIFSVAGVFGLLGFAIYLVVISKLAFDVVHASRGVSLALLVVLLVRSITEVPVQFGAITGADFISHLAFLLLVGALVSKQRSAPTHNPITTRPASSMHAYDH